MNVAHHFAGGLYAKETIVKAGQYLVQHRHEYDHLSILSSGTVELLVDGVRSEVVGPACLTIAAGKHHGVKALTDVVWYCIHATECTDPDHVDEVLVVDSDPQEMAQIIEGMQ